MDVNGDGRADLIFSWYRDGQWRTRVWLADEDGFQAASSSAADRVLVSYLR
jgi:hypothetical protein